MSRRPSLDEALRAEARLARRPAPPGLLARVLAGVGAHPAAVAPAVPEVRARRTALRPVLGLAAAVLALAALRLALPAGLNGGSPSRGLPLSALRSARARLAEPRLSADVEHPLLQELELFGQDTARAASALARDLPGPLGDLFAPR